MAIHPGWDTFVQRRPTRASDLAHVPCWLCQWQNQSRGVFRLQKLKVNDPRHSLRHSSDLLFAHHDFTCCIVCWLLGCYCSSSRSIPVSLPIPTNQVELYSAIAQGGQLLLFLAMQHIPVQNPRREPFQSHVGKTQMQIRRGRASCEQGTWRPQPSGQSRAPMHGTALIRRQTYQAVVWSDLPYSGVQGHGEIYN